MELKRVVVKPYAKDKFELVEDYYVPLPEYAKPFCGGIFRGPTPLKIPKGYLTNGANTPRAFWSLFPPNSPEYLSGIVIHDYLCDWAKSKGDYKIADEVLKEAMSALGVASWKVKLFYVACRVYHKVKYRR
ncbi:MAG: DUF1353 domain-containing protein [Campylobacter sp.]|nr:DUF1353 domain-containing protein [Campylobacter sp.]